jgi:hypothetical protein
MGFLLPPNFGSQVNQIEELLGEAEAAGDLEKERELTRRALIASCNMLQKIDLEAFHRECDAILSTAQRNNPDWPRKIFGDSNDFEFFLCQIETWVLKKAEIDQTARDRIRPELAKLRLDALRQSASITANDLTATHRYFMEGICYASATELSGKRVSRSREAKRTRHRHIVDGLVSGAGVANCAGALVCHIVAIPALAASLTLLGVYGKTRGFNKD